MAVIDCQYAQRRWGSVSPMRSVEIRWSTDVVVQGWRARRSCRQDLLAIQTVFEDGGHAAIRQCRPLGISQKTLEVLDNSQSCSIAHMGESPTSTRNHLPPGILAPKPVSLRHSCSWA